MTATSNALVDIKAQIQAELAALAGSVPAPSGLTVSLKGRLFTLPDGRSSPGPMQCIILDHRNTRTYYKGVYNPNQREQPTCFAIAKEIDDLHPSANATKPNAPSCKECPYDAWGSATNGSKGKACKNAIRIAIIPVDFDDTTDPMLLTVSPTGIKSFSKMINDLKAKGRIPAQVVTEISFNPNESFPTLVFKELTQHDRIELVWRLREKAQAMLDKEPSAS